MLLSPRRLFFGTGTALVAMALLAAISMPSRVVATDASRRAAAAARQLDSLLATRQDSTRAIALSYLERARLGMGSPFRLIDQATRDPRIPDSTGALVAWTIVGMILDKATYEIPTAVLDDIGVGPVGAGHLALIGRLIGSAKDPRVAETTLRLAYGLAAANGTLSTTAVPIITDVIALTRDRALAQRDLRHAISRANADGVDLIAELIHLRVTRDHEVERPLLRALSEDDQTDAIEAVRDVLREVESVAARSGESRFAAPMLDPTSAMVLARLGSRLPPSAATRVTVQSRAGVLRADTTLGKFATQNLVGATNEETLVAAYAFADHESGGRSTGAARVITASAVALRALAQERVWFPGDLTPSAGAVVGRFGLRDITFDRDLPVAWHPYYVQMISSALDDIRRVFTGYQPTNLTIRVGMSGLPDSALAMHDPRTRTLRLSAMTTGGTMAHELAHDLDWQAARRLFARAGGYATDRSVAEKHLALASSVRGLTAARVVGRERPSPFVSSRPAEVFARGVDWFVADALAQMGRSNGYLTAIQDPVIAGFAATPADAPSLRGAVSLVSGLIEMTFLPDSAGAAYVQRWRSLDHIDPAAVMLRLLDTPVAMRRGMSAPFGLSAETMTELATGALCRVAVLREGSPRDQLLALIIEERAKGIVVRRARYTPPATRPAWARAILGEILWDEHAADDVLRRTTAAVAEGAGRAGLIALPPAPFRPDCE